MSTDGRPLPREGAADGSILLCRRVCLMKCVLSMDVYYLDGTPLVCAVLCALVERLFGVLDGTTLPTTRGQGARIVRFPLCVFNSVAFSGFVNISA